MAGEAGSKLIDIYLMLTRNHLREGDMDLDEIVEDLGEYLESHGWDTEGLIKGDR